MKKGFTLIEILIVISVLAVLALIIIPNFVGFDREARISATKANLESLRTAIMLYRAKKGTYPTQLQSLVSDTFLDGGVVKTFINEIPIEQITDAPASGDTETRNSVENDTNLANMNASGPGWFYHTSSGRVFVNWTNALDAAVWNTSDSPAKW
ncbi:MAG TPA: type II secretion system protein [bacterium]|nr:type II secretion system protein [bacterium]